MQCVGKGYVIRPPRSCRRVVRRKALGFKEILRYNAKEESPGKAGLFLSASQAVEYNPEGTSAMAIMRPTRSVAWTSERIAKLATPEVRQLRANAERLGDPEIMGRCDAVLAERRSVGSAKPRSSTRKPAVGGAA